MTDDKFKRNHVDEFVKNFDEDKVKLFCLFEIGKDNVLKMTTHASDDAGNKDFYLLYFAIKDHLQQLENQILEAIKHTKVKAGDLAH